MKLQKDCRLVGNKVMGKFIDLTGQKFFRWTVIRRVHTLKKKTMWECICECGNIGIVCGGDLKCGNHKSCGCLSTDILVERNYKHGFAKRTNNKLKKFYKTYQGMLDRCYNINNSAYSHYGGRGIKVCNRWLGENGFESFIEDMFGGWNESLTLDRIDNNKGYSPENCRWTNHINQSNNRRSNHLITFNGKTQTLSEWAREIGVAPASC